MKGTLWRAGHQEDKTGALVAPPPEGAGDERASRAVGETNDERIIMSPPRNGERIGPA